MNRLIEFFRERRNPPTVRIDHFGMATTRPQANVAVWSRRGMQSVYTFDLSDAGDAKATMYGRDLARLLGIRVVDSRRVAK